MNETHFLSGAMSKASFIAMDPSRHMGVLQILMVAGKIPCKNKKLMLPVLLLAFLPCSLLSMGKYVSTHHLLINLFTKLFLLTSKDPNTPQFYDLLLEIKREAASLMDISLIFSIFSYVATLFSTMIIIYTTAVTSTGQQITYGDLLAKIKGTWKGLLVTCLQLYLLSAGYSFLLLSLIVVVILNASGLVGLMVGSVLAFLPATLFYAYLLMVWSVGVVISVLEEGCYGLQALGKAGEHVKGNRRKGFLITFIFVACQIAGGFVLGQPQPKKGTQNTTVLVMLNLVLLLNLYYQMVYTAFYHECKRIHDEEGEPLGMIAYKKLHVALNGDEAIP